MFKKDIDECKKSPTNSETIPSQAQLNNLLETAFRGENQGVYTSLLQENLSPGNVFSATEGVQVFLADDVLTNSPTSCTLVLDVERIRQREMQRPVQRLRTITRNSRLRPRGRRAEVKELGDGGEEFSTENQMIRRLLWRSQNYSSAQKGWTNKGKGRPKYLPKKKLCMTV